MSINAPTSNVSIRGWHSNGTKFKGDQKLITRNACQWKLSYKINSRILFRKTHPSHFMCCMSWWMFCSNIIKPATDWMTGIEYRLIFFHLFCICLYIRFYTKVLPHPLCQRKMHFFYKINRIKEKSKSQKLLLFRLINTKQNPQCACPLVRNH